MNVSGDELAKHGVRENRNWSVGVYQGRYNDLDLLAPGASKQPTVLTEETFHTPSVQYAWIVYLERKFAEKARLDTHADAHK